MAYATVADVNLLNHARAPFTGSTLPSDTEVVGWLEQTAQEINGILKAVGHDPSGLDPAATTGPVLVLRSYNALGANARAEAASKNDARAKLAAKAWEEAKAALRANELDLDLPDDDDNPLAFSTAPPIFSITDEMRGIPGHDVSYPGDGYTHNDF